MVSLDQTFNLLVTSGFIDNVVPFMLFFALFYTTLSMPVLGFKKKEGAETKIVPLPKNLRIIISASLAFVIMAPHYMSPGSQYDIVPVLFKFWADIALVFVALLFVLMGMGLVGTKDVKLEYGYYFTIGAIILTIYLLLTYSGFILSIGGISNDAVSAAIALLVFYLLVGFMTGKD